MQIRNLTGTTRDGNGIHNGNNSNNNNKQRGPGRPKVVSSVIIIVLLILNLCTLNSLYLSRFVNIKEFTILEALRTTTASATASENDSDRNVTKVEQESNDSADESSSSSSLPRPRPRPSCYQSSILPKRIYTVIGLESSGTSFTAQVIKNGLGIEQTREGAKPYSIKPWELRKNGLDDALFIPAYEMENRDIQTQHFSLPKGGTCMDHKVTPIVDVVLPSQCTRDHPFSEHDNEEVQRCCNEMAEDLFDIRPNGAAVKYPKRYHLDIVSHKDWYDAHGVDQWMIIVLRDPDVSIAARSQEHCTDMDRLKEEEQVGKDIIIDAINKYILGEDDDERRVTRDTYKFWYAKNFQNNSMEGVNTDANTNTGSGVRRRKLRATSPITSKNNVVLVSYESMMDLGDVYIKMLYKTLDIETDYQPEIRNGNTKYIVKNKE
eukprot:CAMPEP_0204617378 /NCGR_PEP_ID=MMETSP0717-20131115/4376_1 /ASSEMBLY_ACC=CAM_ASM_000666 /TAXON_ID=230516 /ORGANISM="Chaetoceros curvisetus" /LENGTH=433 /DNA_ID=CAMNT_0051630899 /DNA_START=58 /DNA_END=1359 /DNA_ORIENTATION=+